MRSTSEAAILSPAYETAEPRGGRDINEKLKTLHFLGEILNTKKKTCNTKTMIEHWITLSSASDLQAMLFLLIVSAMCHDDKIVIKLISTLHTIL